MQLQSHHGANQTHNIILHASTFTQCAVLAMGTHCISVMCVNGEGRREKGREGEGRSEREGVWREGGRGCEKGKEGRGGRREKGKEGERRSEREGVRREGGRWCEKGKEGRGGRREN